MSYSPINSWDYTINPSYYIQEIAVEMHPDSAIKVSGITTSIEPFPHIFAKTSDGQFIGSSELNNGDIDVRYNVYDKNMALIYSQSKNLSAISDTSRYIQFGLSDPDNLVEWIPERFHPYYTPMYDFFFDTTLELTDTFYVSETMTHVSDTLSLYPGIPVIIEFHAFGGNARILPWEKRMYRETLDDTIWQEEEYGWHVTYLFPIIERYGDTCPQVRDVQCFKGTSTQFFLRWAGGVNHHDWQVSYGPAGTAPENGTIIECNQRQTSLITVDPDSHYVAYVRARCRFARDEWGPWSDSVSIWLNQPTDAIEYAFPDIAVTLTPNPAADAVTVTTDATLLALELRDPLGRTVLSQHPSANSTTLDVSTLPAGTYILRLHTPQGVAKKKLVVK